MIVTHRAERIEALIGWLHYLFAALFLAITVTAIVGLHRTADGAFKQFAHHAAQVAAVHQLADRLADSRVADMAAVPSAPTAPGKQPVDLVEEQIASLVWLSKDEPVAAGVQRLKREWSRYQGERARLQAVTRNGSAEAAGRGLATAAARYDAFDSSARHLNAQILRATSDENGAAKSAGSRLSLVVLLLGGCGLAATFFIRVVELCREDVGVSEATDLDTGPTQPHAGVRMRDDMRFGPADRRPVLDVIERITAHGGYERLAVLVVDLDRFEPMKDLADPQAGVETLRLLAERLSRSSPPENLAWLGRDKFAILVPLRDGIEDANRAAHNILQALGEPLERGERQGAIGASIGIALYPDHGLTAPALLRAAEAATCHAKAEARGRYCLFEPAMQAEMERRMQFDTDLLQAIDAGEIQPYYQPLVAVQGCELAGFEVLARWIHPHRGVVKPDEFIQAASERGLLPQLTDSILRQACQDARDWPENIRLSVNLAPGQLRDPLLPARLAAILDECEIAADRIEIEITEEALIGNLETARTVLVALRKLGMTIALDDFGTGYSSLYHLRELDFDKIKIDKSFVHAFDRGEEKAKIVRAIIALAKSLGLETAAEGIEDVGQWARLAASGCDYGQGYLFGHPMDKARADALLGDLTATQPAPAVTRSGSAGASGPADIGRRMTRLLDRKKNDPNRTHVQDWAPLDACCASNERVAIPETGARSVT